jgi:hypothetical protein
MRSFLSSTIALAFGSIPLVSAAGAATQWLADVVTINRFATPTVSYVSCIGANQCYCGTISDYTVPDGCQTSAPASITGIFASNGDFNSDSLTGAVLFSSKIWIANIGGSDEGAQAAVQVSGGSSIPAPSGINIPSVTAAATAGGSSSTTSGSSSTSPTASSTGTPNAAAPLLSAGTVLIASLVAGIAAGAILL